MLSKVEILIIQGTFHLEHYHLLGFGHEASKRMPRGVHIKGQNNPNAKPSWQSTHISIFHFTLIIILNINTNIHQHQYRRTSWTNKNVKVKTKLTEIGQVVQIELHRKFGPCVEIIFLQHSDMLRLDVNPSTTLFQRWRKEEPHKGDPNALLRPDSVLHDFCPHVGRNTSKTPDLLYISRCR